MNIFRRWAERRRDRAFANRWHAARLKYFDDVREARETPPSPGVDEAIAEFNKHASETRVRDQTLDTPVTRAQKAADGETV